MMDAAFLEDFRRTVDTASVRLLVFSENEAARRPAPTKWSKKEIIGHLIDSAANNHGRFVQAQLQDDLVFPSYDQDDWVKIQKYQHRPWTRLVGLWHTYNHHIADMMAATDAEALSRVRVVHNLDRIAWKMIHPSQPATLDYFMRDYVAHLKHHLEQAFR